MNYALNRVEGAIDENIWTTSMDFNYAKIVRESDKSWTLEMSGGAITSFSKKYCRIVKEDNLIIAPKWLLHKIAGWL